VAYKQKLTSGGAGLTVMTPDDKAVFTINKRDGKCVPFGKVNEQVFTDAVIAEALELTKGLGYQRLGSITTVTVDKKCEEVPAEKEKDADDEKVFIGIVLSAEYREFMARYTDKNGKFSYQLMNKDLMQFAAKSSIVGKMLADKAGVEAIVSYIVNARAADLARNKGMKKETLAAFIDVLDSMETRSAFKELRAYLRTRSSKGK